MKIKTLLMLSVFAGTLAAFTLAASAVRATENDGVKNTVNDATVTFGPDAPHTIYITGRGHAMQSCDVQTFNMCQMMLQDQAKRDGERDTSFNCSLQQGTLEGLPYCSTYCNPMIPPPYPSSPGSRGSQRPAS